MKYVPSVTLAEMLHGTKWISTDTKPPLEGFPYVNVSVNVWVRLKGETFAEGFYSFSGKCWYTLSSTGHWEKGYNPVIGWCRK